MLGSKKGILLLLAWFFAIGCAESKSGNTKTRIRQSASPVSELDQPDKPEHLACAKETCGEASSLPYFSAPIQDSDRQLYNQYVSKLLEDYVQLETSSVRLKNEVLSRFSQMQIDQVSDAYLVFINFLYLQKFSDSISTSIAQTRQGIRIDINTLKQELQKQGLREPQQINWVVLLARTIYESEIFYANYYLSQYPLEIFVEKVYPGQDILSGIAHEAEKLQAIQKRVSEIYPILKNNAVAQNFIFEKALRKEPLAPDEKQDFIDSRMTLLSIQEILPGGRWRGFLLQRPVNVRLMAQELMQKAKKSSLAKVDSLKLNEESQKLSFACSFFMTSSIASSPTPQQNQRFLSLISNLKSEAKAVIGRSRYTSDEVLQAVDKISIMLPATKQETTAALVRALKNEISASTETQSLVAKLNLQNQEDKELVLLMLAGQYQDESDDEKPLSDLKEFCEDHIPESISDASYSAYQKINMGWRSVLYPQYGYGIASHEMGHVISAADSISPRAVFARVKSCLQENQNGEEKFVEEDFADLFAVQMMKAKPQSNYSCLLLSQEKDNFTDLKMVAPQESTHSSSFYRLIAIGTQLNTLTPTCQAAKQASPQGQRMKNCWGL